MNNNKLSRIDQQIKTELMQYAVTRYGREFEEVFYETAIDATQSYVLCLTDMQGRVFNVYEHAETGARTDDYKNSIADHKMRDFLKDYLGLDILGGEIGVMAVMHLPVELEVLEKMSAQECIDQFGLYSLIFVYQFDGEKGSIEKNSEKILEIYQKLQKINADTIDFNVVVTSGDATAVQNTRVNMRYRYSGNWYSYDCVQEYISDANPKLTDVTDIVALVKE